MPLTDHLRSLATADGSNPRDLDAIVAAIGDARIVLIGEASHGTHEFYAMRAAITRRLIETNGFRAVTVEGDWPDTRRVDRFVRGTSPDADADMALSGFKRFPHWMWRNTVVRDFVSWLRRWNDARDDAERCGFYGLDLYSLHTSIDAVLRYLERVDPDAARRARERYSCFEHVGGDDPQAYGFAASRSLIEPCEQEVVRQLAELRHCADEYVAGAGSLGEDAFFSAEQNARLVANAERYYRSMFQGRVSSWNLRDTHMAETLDAVVAHIERDGGDAKVCVWAHNSHLGDARATQMGRGGELNVGQLARERFGDTACLVGFTTYTGTVTAAHDWDEPADRRNVRPGLPESFEAHFHRQGDPRFLLDLRDDAVRRALREPRLERAIGVIYRPETERQSHYFEADLPAQFDLVMHLDETRALEPLERSGGWEQGEPPETYPFAV
ncbi:MAG TPA: erythromycin esterase family protein [Gemmatimonadaceae bacterium]|nr:erythromycin esterase family protein [Gemmatimonadaceae bacterium]